MITAHGVVDTPAFMPVGTQGAVKALTPRDLEDLGVQIILGNTYHLSLRPGDHRIARLGGLHRFIGWTRPILTDSGGYQVYSLSARRVISEEGIRFRSHLDGSEHRLSPESATEIQARLGSDIAMVLDECLGPSEPLDVVRASTLLTARWARRCRDRFLALYDGEPLPLADLPNPGQVQFGIVQGGVHPELRRLSVDETTAIGFEGYALGGLGVGEPKEVLYDIVAGTAPQLPPDRPRYLMGVGTPADLVEGVARGIDLFDCVLPTRNARNGQLFTRTGPLSIKNARYADDPRPPDPSCACYTCRTFSRAYLRHLFMAGEMTASTLNTVHNLQFYLDTLSRIRDAIVFRSFEKFRVEFQQTLSHPSCDS
jgi:queuine tRNA-ribosyltransferase